MIFFTADLHFSHDAVIDFENRPFKSSEDMNNEIIRRWNTLVSVHDEVYILGDISFAGRTETTILISSLNGTKYLVVGNHDKLNEKQREMFAWVKNYYKLKIHGHRFILFHYPIFAWDGKEKGYIHLHGHTHTNSRTDIELKNKINVGMDFWAYAPVGIDEILNQLNQKKNK